MECVCGLTIHPLTKKPACEVCAKRVARELDDRLGRDRRSPQWHVGPWEGVLAVLRALDDPSLYAAVYSRDNETSHYALPEIHYTAWVYVVLGSLGVFSRDVKFTADRIPEVETALRTLHARPVACARLREVYNLSGSPSAFAAARAELGL